MAETLISFTEGLNPNPQEIRASRTGGLREGRSMTKRKGKRIDEFTIKHDGKAYVQIELATRDAKVLDKLRAAGFELVVDEGKTTLTGRVPLERLAALAEIDAIKLILPKI